MSCGLVVLTYGRTTGAYEGHQRGHSGLYSEFQVINYFWDKGNIYECLWAQFLKMDDMKLRE